MNANNGVLFRDGCNDLFKLLHCHKIPLLIFSAGLGDIIEEVLRQRSTYYDNMKVVSNFMKYDKNVSFKYDKLCLCIS